MPDELLGTKLTIPPLRPNRVSRQGLIERLDGGRLLGHKLTLISAPAGFGKTTLVGARVAGLQLASLALQGSMVGQGAPSQKDAAGFIEAFRHAAVANNVARAEELDLL